MSHTHKHSREPVALQLSSDYYLRAGESREERLFTANKSLLSSPPLQLHFKNQQDIMNSFLLLSVQELTASSTNRKPSIVSSFPEWTVYMGNDGRMIGPSPRCHQRPCWKKNVLMYKQHEGLLEFRAAFCICWWKQSQILKPNYQFLKLFEYESDVTFTMATASFPPVMLFSWPQRVARHLG